MRQRSPRRRRVIRIVMLSVLGALALTVTLAWSLLRSDDATIAAERARLEQVPLAVRQQQAAAVQERVVLDLGVEEFESDVAAAQAAQRLAEQTAALTGQPVASTQPGGAVADPKNLVRVRTILLNKTDANVWLSENVHRWLHEAGYRQPPEARSPVVVLRAGQVFLGFDYEAENFSQSFSGRVQMTIETNGKASLSLRDAKAGKLPLPQDSIGATLKKVAPAHANLERAAAWFDKLRYVQFTPMVRLTDRTKARLLSAKIVQGDTLKLTLRLEPRGTTLPPPSLTSAEELTAE